MQDNDKPVKGRDYLVETDEYGCPTDVVFLPSEAFYEMFQPLERCIHPGVFADLEHEFQHCWTCGRDVPNSEL